MTYFQLVLPVVLLELLLDGRSVFLLHDNNVEQGIAGKEHQFYLSVGNNIYGHNENSTANNNNDHFSDTQSLSE